MRQGKRRYPCSNPPPQKKRAAVKITRHADYVNDNRDLLLAYP